MPPDDNDADVFLNTGTYSGADWPAWEPIGTDGDPVPGSDRCALAVGTSECSRCLSHGITPLQQTRSAIEGAINALQSPTGTTNIPQGLGWAWRVLMPSAPFTEAIENPPYRRQQAIVLLTDGENVGGSGDGYKTVFGLGAGAGPAGMNGRLQTLAANIKAQGVLIYVIQFANNNADLRALLESIASGPDAPFYHFAPSASELTRVFREVANNLSELRLSK